MKSGSAESIKSSVSLFRARFSMLSLNAGYNSFPLKHYFTIVN